MQTGSIHPHPFNVVAPCCCGLKPWCIQSALVLLPSRVRDSVVAPTGTAAHGILSAVPVPRSFAAGAAATAPRGCTVLRACFGSSPLLSLRSAGSRRVSGRWPPGENGNAETAAAASLSSLSFAETFAPAVVHRLLFVFVGLATATAGAARAPPRPLAARYFTNCNMRRLNSLSQMLPVRVPTTGARGGGAAAAEDVVHVPRLLYGTAWKKERTENLVYDALRQGFRGVDTACQPKHYNEPGVGRGIARFLRETQLPRSSLFIQTKFTPVGGHDASLPLPYDARASVTEQVWQSLQTSLHNLQCDYLDALLLHSPLPTMEQTLEAWRVLEEAVEKGKIRLIGISNAYDVSTLQALYQSARIKPTLLQNRFYSDTGYDVEVRAFCKQHGMAYEAFWTLTANPHILRSQAVERAAARTGCTPEQVWFRYLLDKGFIVLTGTTSIHHMQDDLQSLSIELTQQDCAAIDEEVAAST